MELIDRLGTGDENAFHSLMELPDEFIPELIDSFHVQTDNHLRSEVVRAISQHRLPTTLPFLASLLADADDGVWKQALDGMVTIGGKQAKCLLQQFRDQRSIDNERLSWIDEAYDQFE